MASSLKNLIEKQLRSKTISTRALKRGGKINFAKGGSCGPDDKGKGNNKDGTNDCFDFSKGSKSDKSRKREEDKRRGSGTYKGSDKEKTKEEEETPPVGNTTRGLGETGRGVISSSMQKTIRRGGKFAHGGNVDDEKTKTNSGEVTGPTTAGVKSAVTGMSDSDLVELKKTTSDKEFRKASMEEMLKRKMAAKPKPSLSFKK